VGSCWGHAARIFEIMPKGLSVKYISEPLLDRRGDNDSFADKGVVNRYGIAINGYHRIGNVFFGHESFEAYHIRRVIRYEFNLEQFLEAKLSCWKNPAHEDRKALNALFRKAYSDASLLSKLKYLFFLSFPAWLFYAVKRIYGRIKRYWKGALCLGI